MATYDSAYLLDWFNRYAGRAESDGVTNETKYKYLTDAQNEVVGEIAGRWPHVLYGPARPLTTVDGKVFTFGPDSNGYPLSPLGKVGIYPSTGSIPDYPWIEGIDYLNEGHQIRIPNDRVHMGALYWRGITPPADITATTQPALLPPPARELIVIRAVKNFAQSGNLNPDLAAQMAEQWARAFPLQMLTYKTQFRSGGALAPLAVPQGYSAYGYATYPGI